MSNKKNPPHIFATLVCLVLVLGLSGSCNIRAVEGGVKALSDAWDRLTDSLIWVSSAGLIDSLKKTDTEGENIETLPAAGEVTHATVIPTGTGGDNSSLPLGWTAAGAEAVPKGAAEVAAEEPRLIFVDNTTAQILNLGTNTLGAQAQLTGRIQLGIPVAVSGDGAFAAAMVRRIAEETGERAHSVDLIDLSSMTRTGTIELPEGCGARGIAFPSRNERIRRDLHG